MLLGKSGDAVAQGGGGECPGGAEPAGMWHQGCRGGGLGGLGGLLQPE